MSGDRISIIAAIANNRAIGRNNNLPWNKIPWDLKNFKFLTKDHPIIMGANTFTSIIDTLGKPLPDRYTIVVSRMRDLIRTSEYAIARSVEDAFEIAHARENGRGEIFIAGGGQIYEQTLHIADRLYLTFVDTNVDGADTFFPAIPAKQWRAVHTESIWIGDDSPYHLRFKIFDRKHL